MLTLELSKLLLVLARGTSGTFPRCSQLLPEFGNQVMLFLKLLLKRRNLLESF